MKKVKIFLGVIFLLFGGHLKGQKLTDQAWAFYLEAGLLSSELQLQSFLLQKSAFNETFEMGFGGEVMASFVYKNHWTGQIGLTYNWYAYRFDQSFELTITNPDNLQTYTNTYNFDLNHSLTSYQLDFEILIDQSKCSERLNESRPAIQDGETFNAGFTSFNSIKTLGIPLKLGRIFTTSKFRWYLSGSMVPTLVIGKTFDLEDRFSVGAQVNSHRRNYCFDDQGNSVDRFFSSSNITQSGWNLFNSRLDLIGEFGCLHQTKKGQYKLGVFYGQSLTPYTQINEENFNSQMIGLKIAYARLVKATNQ